MTKQVKRPRASVQQHYVRAREIIDNVLCLWEPSSPTRRCYRAVLEVEPLNFLLKAEEEQDALIERYREILKGLTFPVQILLRHQRLDLRPYLARIQAQIPSVQSAAEAGERAGATSEGQAALPAASALAARRSGAPDEEGEPPGWSALAESLSALLQQTGSQRTLIARHWYLIIPAPDLRASSRRWSLRHPRQRTRKEALMAHALQDLAIRAEVLRVQLASLGLRSRRVSGEDLVRLSQSCLTPERALLHPLHASHLASVGHFPLNRPASPPHGPAAEPEREGTSGLFPEERRSAPPRRRRVRPRRGRARLPASLVPAPDFLRLADVLAPGSIVEERDGVAVDDEWARGIVVTAFPREVSTRGWLAPLLLLDELFDLSWHLHPQNPATMMRQLRRRRLGYASANHLNRQRGRLDDLEMGVAQQDVTRLLGELASGGERIVELSFLLLVRAPNKAALDERTERLLSVLQTVLLDAVAHPTTFEHGPALRSCLPEGRDEVRRTITLDTASLATTFPFLSNALTMPEGTFLGLTGTGEPVLLDPWDPSLENPHAFVGGVTGAGKSYFGKLWLERSLLANGLAGEQCSVIDPDGEYTPLAQALGGTTVYLAAGSPHHLNPFDLRPPGCDFDTYLAGVKKLDRLREKIADLLRLLDLLLADHGTVLGAREKALLDRALAEVYRRVGISGDPRTHYHQPPLLRDLAEVLKSGVCGEDTFALGLRLSRYVEGSLAGLFANQTNVPLDAPLLVWDVQDLRGDLRPVGIFLIADTIWTQAIQQWTVRRALSIDEAASLIAHPEGGRFLADLSRRARKRYLRLVVMTQNPEQFAQDEHGSVVAANAAIKVLKKQDRTSVRAVATRFGLTSGEEQRLLAFGEQEALLLAGDRRVLLSISASPQEHALITTNPAERAWQTQQAQREQHRGAQREEGIP